MDPTAALASILRFLEQLQRPDDDDQPDIYDAYDVLERVSGLCNWLKKGGFLPNQWSAIPGPHELRALHHAVEGWIKQYEAIEDAPEPVQAAMVRTAKAILDEDFAPIHERCKKPA